LFVWFGVVCVNVDVDVEVCVTTQDEAIFLQ
jgi:hypothetical protein